jgi:hypothetical protein
MDTTMRVWDLAHGRSGDKGDVCNVGVVAYDSDGYEVLKTQLTADRVKEHFGALVTGRVDRYEMPNILALNFVLNGGLDGGGTQSLRSDALGKVMYAWLLRMEIDAELIDKAQSHRPQIAVPAR